MADFTGFYFNGHHSSIYGLVRTSDGDRYKEDLIPEFEDREIKLVGGDGDLYQGRRFKTKKLSIQIAFDHITEQQFRGLRQWLGTDQLCELRFDERPYKTYWVKPSSPPELEYICFMEDKEDGSNGDKERIYKGEGSIEFMAYDPFGYCIDNSWELTPQGAVKVNPEQPSSNFDILKGINWQEIESYFPYNINISNETEWGGSSGLKDSLFGYNTFSSPEKIDENYICNANLYNPGDFDSDFQFYVKILETHKENAQFHMNFYSTSPENPIYYFKFKVGGLNTGDVIIIDTKKHSLAVYDKNGKRNLRYDLIISASWPKIPKGETIMRVSSSSNYEIPLIKYNYKYY